MNDPRHMTPAEVDGLLFPILEKIANVESHIDQYAYLLGEKPRRNYMGRETFSDPGVQRKQFEEGREKDREKLADLEDEAMPFEQEFENRGGWTRYVVVSGGHLHKRACHTLTPGRTMVGQVAEASGLADSEVVGKFGETACTKCFPDAPVAEKKAPEEEGYCRHSGEFVAEERTRKYGMREIATCECGSVQTLTSTGKLRKHKAGAK